MFLMRKNLLLRILGQGENKNFIKKILLNDDY